MKRQLHDAFILITVNFGKTKLRIQRLGSIVSLDAAQVAFLYLPSWFMVSNLALLSLFQTHANRGAPSSITKAGLR